MNRCSLSTLGVLKTGNTSVLHLVLPHVSTCVEVLQVPEHIGWDCLLGINPKKTAKARARQRVVSRAGQTLAYEQRPAGRPVPVSACCFDNNVIWLKGTSVDCLSIKVAKWNARSFP